jgi:hypothetical protein
MKKKRQGETPVKDRFSEFHAPLNANVLFLQVFKNLTLCMTNQTQGTDAVFS